MNNVQDLVKAEPLVSVGIPTYNRPAGLRRTLECITGQTYKNLEIIVSDNCSPGFETEGVVREFMAKDSRIQYYRQEKNQGPTFNFQFVLEKATGEYFMWAADDDEWEFFYVDRIIQEFEKLGEDFVAINFEAQYIDEYNKKFDYFAEGFGFYTFSSNSGIVRLKHLIKFNYGNLVYSIYRMCSFKKLKNMIFVENEIPFLLQLIQTGNWRVIPEVGFYKKTNNATYLQAKWEMCGGGLCSPEGSKGTPVKNYYSLMRYHWTALKNIYFSIDLLTISVVNKLFLKFYVLWGLSFHYFALIIGYKRPRSQLMEE